MLPNLCWRAVLAIPHNVVRPSGRQLADLPGAPGELSVSVSTVELDGNGLASYRRCRVLIQWQEGSSMRDWRNALQGKRARNLALIGVLANVAGVYVVHLRISQPVAINEFALEETPVFFAATEMSEPKLAAVTPLAPAEPKQIAPVKALTVPAVKVAPQPTEFVLPTPLRETAPRLKPAASSGSAQLAHVATPSQQSTRIGQIIAPVPVSYHTFGDAFTDISGDTLDIDVSVSALDMAPDLGQPLVAIDEPGPTVELTTLRELPAPDQPVASIPGGQPTSEPVPANKHG